MKLRIALLCAVLLAACDGRTGDAIRSLTGNTPTAPVGDQVVIAYSIDVSCTTLTVRDETISSGSYDRLHVDVVRHDTNSVVVSFDVGRGRDRSVDLAIFVSLSAPERFRLSVVAVNANDDPTSLPSASAFFFVPQRCG